MEQEAISFNIAWTFESTWRVIELRMLYSLDPRLEPCGTKAHESASFISQTSLQTIHAAQQMAKE
jgi:hypothetical protein